MLTVKHVDPNGIETLYEASGNVRYYPPNSVSVTDVAGHGPLLSLSGAGTVYVMNDKGRTISRYNIYDAGAPNSPAEPSRDSQDEAEALRLLQAMPYAVAAAIRETARFAVGKSATYLIDLLDKARVAVDVAPQG